MSVQKKLKAIIVLEKLLSVIDVEVDVVYLEQFATVSGSTLINSKAMEPAQVDKVRNERKEIVSIRRICFIE